MRLTHLCSTLAIALTASILNGSIAYTEEVHVIGVFAGKRVKESAFQKKLEELGFQCYRNPAQCVDQSKILSQFPSRVDVSVTRTGEPLTLVLTAYEPTKWRIKVAEGVKIKRIILSGNYDQSLRKNKALKGVPVEKSSFESGDSNFFYFSGDDREKPVGYPTGENSMCVRDSTLGTNFPSNFARTLRQLKRRNLVPTTIQSRPYGSPASHLEISAQTSADGVQKIRDAGLCYQNPDGSMSRGDT